MPVPQLTLQGDHKLQIDRDTDRQIDREIDR